MHELASLAHSLYVVSLFVSVRQYKVVRKDSKVLASGLSPHAKFLSLTFARAHPGTSCDLFNQLAKETR